MKNLRYWSFSLGALVAYAINIMAYAQTNPSQNPAANTQQNYSGSQNPFSNQNVNANQPLRMGVVDTKRCLEESKLGKQEQANFERMKQQMEGILQDKEKVLEEIEIKLNDDDYMDSISDEAASELKRKKRTIRSEGMQLQSQYMQTLQQANLKIVQKMTDVIGRASAQVAQDTTSAQPVDIIFTDEACTFYSPRLDVSDRVIAKMNAIFEEEPKDNPPKIR